MDLHVKNYILFKARTLGKQKKKLEQLNKAYERMRRDIIDESPTPPDGMPRGKGKTSDPVMSKVIRLEKISERIKAIDKEVLAFDRAEKRISELGEESFRIYKETIRGTANLEYKAEEYGMHRKTLWNYRTKLMKIIAEELGEYVDLDGLDD